MQFHVSLKGIYGFVLLVCVQIIASFPVVNVCRREDVCILKNVKTKSPSMLPLLILHVAIDLVIATRETTTTTYYYIPLHATTWHYHLAQLHTIA